jgi:hypothetical protein
VTEEGDFYALYSNQKESKWRDRVPFQDNYLFSVGLFNFIELGGRFFEAPGTGRDLSGNFKLTSEPLFRQYQYLPVLAVGGEPRTRPGLPAYPVRYSTRDVNALGSPPVIVHATCRVSPSRARSGSESL